MSHFEERILFPEFVVKALNNGLTVDEIRAEAVNLSERLTELEDRGGDAGDKLDLMIRSLDEAVRAESDPDYYPGMWPTKPRLDIEIAGLGQAMKAARSHLANYARLAALEAFREATQFQPLDPASPTTRLELRIPQALVDRIDGARGVLSRSEYIRELIESHTT